MHSEVTRDVAATQHVLFNLTSSLLLDMAVPTSGNLLELNVLVL